MDVGGGGVFGRWEDGMGWKRKALIVESIYIVLYLGFVRCNVLIMPFAKISFASPPPKAFPNFSLPNPLDSSNSELTPGPQRRTQVVKRKHTDNPHHAQARQQTNPPIDPQIQKQRSRKQDTPARQRAPEEIVAREQTSRVLRVREGHVDEDALHDDEDGGAVDDYSNHARDPGDVRAGGPGEDEEADGREEAADEGGDEAVFLGAEAVGEDIGHEVEVEVGAVDEDAEGAGDENAGEEDAQGAEGEAVVLQVDKGEDFEEGVVDAVDEGGVDIHKGDGGVFDCDFDGLDQGVDGDGSGLEPFLVDLGLGLEAVVVGELSQAGGAAEEDVGGGGFGNEEEHENEDGASNPENFPE